MSKWRWSHQQPSLILPPNQENHKTENWDLSETENGMSTMIHIAANQPNQTKSQEFLQINSYSNRKRDCQEGRGKMLRGENPKILNEKRPCRGQGSVWTDDALESVAPFALLCSANVWRQLAHWKARSVTPMCRVVCIVWSVLPLVWSVVCVYTSTDLKVHTAHSSLCNVM